MSARKNQQEQRAAQEREALEEGDKWEFYFEDMSDSLQALMRADAEAALLVWKNGKRSGAQSVIEAIEWGRVDWLEKELASPAVREAMRQAGRWCAEELKEEVLAGSNPFDFLDQTLSFRSGGFAQGVMETFGIGRALKWLEGEPPGGSPFNHAGLGYARCRNWGAAFERSPELQDAAMRVDWAGSKALITPLGPFADHPHWRDGYQQEPGLRALSVLASAEPLRRALAFLESQGVSAKESLERVSPNWARRYEGASRDCLTAAVWKQSSACVALILERCPGRSAGGALRARLKELEAANGSLEKVELYTGQLGEKLAWADRFDLERSVGVSVVSDGRRGGAL